MIQRMRNTISIDIHGLSLNGATDVEVFLEQKSSNTRLRFTGEDILVVDDDTLAVTVPKEDAMRMNAGTLRAQVAFTRDGNVPGATKVFYVPVDELIWRDGYGD